VEEAVERHRDDNNDEVGREERVWGGGNRIRMYGGVDGVALL